MPYQLHLLILLLSTLQIAQCAKFQIAYRDGKSSKVKELHPVKRASNIQCASYCLRKIQDCDGFSLDSGHTCRILKGEIKEGDCPGDGCVVRKGYSVFKHRSRNRYLTSDSMARLRNSENNMISFSNTVVGPFGISIVNAKCGDYPLTGFSSDLEFFDGRPFSMVLCYEKLSLRQRPKQVLSFNGDERAHCKGKEGVISELEFHVADDEFKSIAVTCVDMQKIIFDDGPEFIGDGKERYMANCPRGSLMTSVSVRMELDRYSIQVTCKDIDPTLIKAI